MARKQFESACAENKPNKLKKLEFCSSKKKKSKALRLTIGFNRAVRKKSQKKSSGKKTIAVILDHSNNSIHSINEVKTFIESSKVNTPNKGIHIKEIISTGGTTYNGRIPGVYLLHLRDHANKLDNNAELEDTKKLDKTQEVMLFSPVHFINSNQPTPVKQSTPTRQPSKAETTFHNLNELGIKADELRTCAKTLNFDEDIVEETIEYSLDSSIKKKPRTSQNSVMGHSAKDEYMLGIENLAKSNSPCAAPLITYLANSNVEWLHKQAHCHGAESRDKNNLVAGSSLVNTKMMIPELIAAGFANSEQHIVSIKVASKIFNLNDSNSNILKEMVYTISLKDKDSSTIINEYEFSFDNLAIPSYSELPKSTDPKILFEAFKFMLENQVNQDVDNTIHQSKRPRDYCCKL